MLQVPSAGLINVVAAPQYGETSTYRAQYTQQYRAREAAAATAPASSNGAARAGHAPVTHAAVLSAVAQLKEAVSAADLPSAALALLQGLLPTRAGPTRHAAGAHRSHS